MDMQRHWQNILDHTPSINAIDSAGRRYRALKLVPADFALLLHEHLVLWTIRENIPPQIKIELSALSGLQVQCKVKGTDRSIDYLKALQDYWRSALGVSVQVSLEI